MRWGSGCNATGNCGQSDFNRYVDEQAQKRTDTTPVVFLAARVAIDGA
jgi:hypothetical protein